MANITPFVVFAKITPNRGSGRKFEAIRSAERIAGQIFADLTANFAGTIGTPGGSGTSTAEIALDNFSDSNNIVAVKPAFGQEPDQVMINGFYAGSGAVPYAPMTILHDGQYVTGPKGAPGFSSTTMPSEGNIQDTKAIKTAIEAAVTSVAIKIIAMEVSGVKYGRGGFHFPLAND